MANARVELEPIRTPNFVVVKVPHGPSEEGAGPQPTIPVKQLDAAAISDLCDEFRAAMFAKAGVRDPNTSPPETPHD
jgi:hypothetical protein